MRWVKGGDVVNLAEVAGGGRSRFGVVIVDDIEDMRELVRWQLRSRGDVSVVGEAATGREAVALAASVKPDLMFLDITMPEMNGLEALPHILTASPDTRVIVLSALDDLDSQLATRQAGAAYFLVKGGGRRTVLAAVASVLGDLPGESLAV